MRVIYHPEARTEFKDAVSFYLSRESGLGSDFADEVEAALESIQHDPEICEIIEGDIRRRRVRRFSYDLYFRVDGEVLRILVVKHHSRDPDYWKHRI